MKNIFKKVAVSLMAGVLLMGTFSGFGCGSSSKSYDNEKTRLVLASQELDGVFNPFYSSAAADGSVVGMTQIGMLNSDKDGNVAYGEDEACVVLDMSIEEIKDGSKTVNTVYKFVLKNDVKFSNGSPLTMKDVLFNLYTYLDPMYYGSSTIYSTDIVGLQEYRTQQKSKEEQEAFEASFQTSAADRVMRLEEVIDVIYEANEQSGGSSLTDAQMESELTAIQTEYVGYDPLYGTVLEDYRLAKQYFMEELTRDYGYAVGTAQDIKFLDENEKEVALKTDTEAFLYNEGYIYWDDEEYEFVYSLGKESGSWSKDYAINAIYNTFIPNDVISVIKYWGTAMELRSRFAYLEKQAYFDNIQEDEKVTSVSGVVFANKDGSVKVNNTTYNKPEYNEDGSVKSGNEVLQITINEVDPKAIWNFAFTVAPMYYYSSADEIAKFNYVDSFGVKYGDINFQDKVIKDPNKIGLPVGAGAYKATTRSGNSANVTDSSFYADNIVYFERNEHFMFPAKIKYVNYQVVPANRMLDVLYSGEVHYVTPNCTNDNIKDVDRHAKKGIAKETVMTNGYGYIGINAADVPNINVRRAIMHAVNTQLCIDYYLGYSKAIYRPMTRASWAYPTETDTAGQYYAFDPTGETSKKLVEDAGYIPNAKGIYAKGDDVLDYTFTIAGDSKDHPAYNALRQASDILNKIGFKIIVKTDINALKKLNNGDLTVWAAAWGSSVDPDMYQVYHIDSTAGSTTNWGYKAIKANKTKYKTEYDIITELSDIIDQARETTVQDSRKVFYKLALDKVMELAVELPTYQRSDLFAYNSKVIDVNSLTPKADLTPYNGPMAKLWEVSLVQKESK